MGKYQLDTKGKAAVTKYHEKQQGTRGDKTQQIAALRAQYLKKKAKEATSKWGGFFGGIS